MEAAVTDTQLRLEKVDEENARIFNGAKIVGMLRWTDSCWLLADTDDRPIHVFTDIDEVEDVGLAFAKSFEHLVAWGVDLDFFLDPPTFVGPSEGERACWIYTAWKLLDSGKPVDFREWSQQEFMAANAIYRRVRRKYGDSPPDKTAEVKEMTA